MTTSIVYGDVADGYLHSADATYAGSRNGPADGVNAGTSAFYGQTVGGGQYTSYQAFLRFSYPALAATEVPVAAVIQTHQLSQLSTGTARDMELKGYQWSTGGLTTGDWRNPTQLASHLTYATVRDVQGSQGKWTLAGSEDLRALLPAQSFAEFVVASSRQRLGNTPTVDERSSIATADQSGTSLDPALVFSTVTRHRLLPVLGMEAQLSDGSWVMGVREIGSTGVDLIRAAPVDGTLENIATIPLGTTSSSWADVPAAQGLTLTVDTADNFYVVGRAGDVPNSIRIQAYRKRADIWGWTAGTVRTQAAPAHSAPINNVTCAWHSTAGGTLVVFASHAPTEGMATGDPNDLCYLLLSSAYLVEGTGVLLRASGSAQAAGMVLAATQASDFNGFVNEVGTGLDVVSERPGAGLGDFGYMASFKRSQRMGDNASVTVTKYALNSTGTGFAHVSYQPATGFGTKDAGAKVRIVSVGSGQVALVTGDRLEGWGITVQVFQAGGVTPGMVTLGTVGLAGEDIPSMPDGPAVATSSAWDVAYSVTENVIWVYYVDATDPTRLMRTSVSLDTYWSTQLEVPVYTAASPIRSIRVARNARVSQRCHVTLDIEAQRVRIVDNLNLPPLAPTLVPQPNYDAATDATFQWTFQDPNTVDTQSAYQLQVERVSDGTTALDTGKVASSASSHLVPGGTLANGEDYRWRVQTWDTSDAASPWSDWSNFTTSAAGSVNITDPAVDNQAGVITDDYLVAWEVTGTVQAQRRVWVERNDTGALVYDSGWGVTSATTQTVAGMVTDVEHTIRVQVENASGVRSGIGSRLITPSYGTPEVPLVTLTPMPESGYVLVEVTNPPPQGDRPEVVRNRIFRRQVGSSGPWEVLGECEPSGTFRDYTAPGRVPLEYIVRGETD